MSTAADPRDCPYVGLDSFDSAHADYFFGRSRESKIIADHVLARPITVLYGSSGVGKSSILNVGLPAALKQIAQAEREEFDEVEPDAAASAGGGEFVVRWLREWQEPARAEQLIGEWASESRQQPVLMIFDQFEEYFLYREQSGMQGVERALSKLAARRDAPVHLVFGVRDDALHRLDQLRAFIPGILETTIELRGLSDAGVREAILGPIERYNKEFRDQAHAITVEDGFVTTLIRQLKEAETGLGKAPMASADERRIELPYLQLALIKLWAAEGGSAATALRQSTLVDRLGGVGRLVRDHVNGVMGRLSAPEQTLCAKLFDRLVTPIGGKIAYPTAGLAAPEVAGRDMSPRQVEGVLNKLTPKEARILKPVSANGLPGFEIFHDVLGLPLLEWKRSFDAQRERRRSRRLFGGVALAAMLLLAAVVAVGLARPQWFVLLKYGQAASNQDILSNIALASNDEPLNFPGVRMDSVFLSGFSKRLDLQTLDYFNTQGYPPELTFWLFSDSFAVSVPGSPRLSYQYNPPGDYGCPQADPMHRCFADWIRIFTFAGLTVETRTQVISDSTPVTVRLFSRFCFDPNKAQAAQNLANPEMVQAAAAMLGAPLSAPGPICGSAWNPLAAADVPLPSVFPFQLGPLSVTITSRSGYGLFNFLGQLLKIQRSQIVPAPNAYIPPDRTDVVGPPVLATVQDDPHLLTVVASGTDCFAQTTVDGVNYCVPTQAATSKRVFSILAQLIGILTRSQPVKVSP